MCNFLKIYTNKMKTAIIAGIVAVAFIAILIFLKMRNKKKPAAASVEAPVEEKPKGTIYGVMTCPHTVTQTKKYPDYDFVDCSTGGCPSFVTAYPTTRFPDGNIVVGA
jgi:hypothetical protein